MSRLIDVAAVLDRMAKALAGTEQGEACAFAVRLMRERESATPLPMREDPRYRGTDFRSALDVDRASQGGGK